MTRTYDHPRGRVELDLTRHPAGVVVDWAISGLDQDDRPVTDVVEVERPAGTGWPFMVP